METFKSDLSNKKFPITEKVSAKSIRNSVLELIKIDNPQFTDDKFLSMSELNTYREKYVDNFLSKQIGILTDLDKTVLDAIKEKTTLTDKLEDVDDTQKMTSGHRIADKVASFGGSWTFYYFV